MNPKKNTKRKKAQKSDGSSVYISILFWSEGTGEFSTDKILICNISILLNQTFYFLD